MGNVFEKKRKRNPDQITPSNKKNDQVDQIDNPFYFFLFPNRSIFIFSIRIFGQKKITGKKIFLSKSLIIEKLESRNWNVKKIIVY